MNQVALKNINKSYKNGTEKLVILNNFDLNVKKGEFISLMGKSGVGKSTILNILGCIESFESGIYELDEEIIDLKNSNQISKIRNEKIGFVLQNFSLFNEYTALENVEIPLVYRNLNSKMKNRLNKKEIRKLAKEMLKKVSMEEHMNKKPAKLSGGQQQRVAIARALIGSPSLILADEPTGALDRKTSIEIMELLKEINNEGKTIILVTHDNEIAKYSNKVITIE